jgi:RimJ/RimL family protein N-acetyltransferase
MNPITLIPYHHPSHFEILESWITDKYVLLQYSGTHFQFPFTEAQILNYLKEYPERRIYMGLQPDGTPFAFGEIIPQDSSSVRLARLLIGNPGLRGQGLGSAFIKAMINETRIVFGAVDIDLFVFSDNQPAIQCYLKNGFMFMTEEEDKIVQFEDAAYIVKKMSLSRA